MKLLIIILNYKVTDLTIDCLRSLAPRVGGVPGARVAVLENGTGGDAEARLRKAIEENGWGGWVDLSAVHPNRGFTGGNNIVIRESMTSADPPEYVLLLNADTIVHDRALEELVEFMDRTPRAGIAGSRLLFLDGGTQDSAFRFLSVATELNRGLRLGLASRVLRPWVAVPPLPNEPARVEWVSGASMIIRRTMLDEIGLLDEGLYTYFDDVDLCLRAKRAGWQTWYVPGSRVVHLEGASTGVTTVAPKRRPEYWFQARRRFLLKNHGPAYAALVDAAFIAGFTTWRVRQWVQRKPDTAPAHLLEDFVRHSVLRTGFALREVENPAYREAARAEPRAPKKG